MRGTRSGRVSLLAFLAFQGIAVLMTWPLILGLHRDVPGDLGDSLLNMWILAWGAENVPRLLTGQISLQEYWNANIFHPEPVALSFSEHLFGLVLQILPVYHLTGNIILSYNLLFLTTFSLSGLGTFLLTRDILADVVAGRDGVDDRVVLAAAFVAGLIYAFVPFRIAQVAHIQSLSAQWMPLALYGFRRFTRTGTWRPLAGGTAALVMQNWSCGYYLMFFAPVVPLFVVHQLWTSGRLRDWRMWSAFGAAAAVVLGATFPLLTLYIEGQRIHGFQRPLSEVQSLSADVYSYFTAPEALHVWGRLMQAIRKPEGELFFGLIPMALAVIGLLWGVAPAIPRRNAAMNAEGRPIGRGLRIAKRLLAVILALQAAALVMIVFTGGFITSLGGIPIRATNATRILTNASLAFILLLALSPRLRTTLRAVLRSPIVCAALLMVFALWMSLGPTPHTRGQWLQVPGLYGFFYEHVPGFDGLRVPARYAMVAALFLSVVSGAGAAAVLRRSGIAGGATAAGMVLGGALLAEAAFAPMPLNITWGGDQVQPPARVEPAAGAPAVYHHLATMPDVDAVAEFPFGDLAWELRYVYYSTVHWKRLVNGYSGAFPQGYQTRLALFQRVAEHPEEAWQALRATGATHAIVHEQAFATGESALVTRWLADHFAVEIARFPNGDLLFDLDGVFAHPHH